MVDNLKQRKEENTMGYYEDRAIELAEQEEAIELAELEKDFARYIRTKVDKGQMDESALKRVAHVEVESDLTEDELTFLDDLKAYKQSRKDRGLE